MTKYKVIDVRILQKRQNQYYKERLDEDIRQVNECLNSDFEAETWNPLVANICTASGYFVTKFTDGRYAIYLPGDRD